MRTSPTSPGVKTESATQVSGVIKYPGCFGQWSENLVGAIVCWGPHVTWCDWCNVSVSGPARNVDPGECRGPGAGCGGADITTQECSEDGKNCNKHTAADKSKESSKGMNYGPLLRVYF